MGIRHTFRGSATMNMPCRYFLVKQGPSLSMETGAEPSYTETDGQSIPGSIATSAGRAPMKRLVVQGLSEGELLALKKGLRSANAFTLRNSQILLSSIQGQTPQQIAARLHFSVQSVRKVIRCYLGQGLASLRPKRRSTGISGTRRTKKKDRRDMYSSGEMLTVSEAARYLRIHANSVRRWADLGLLSASRIGQRSDRRFKFDDLASFLASRKEQKGAAVPD